MEKEKKKVLDEASALAARISDQARLAYEQEMRETMARVRSEVVARTIKAAEEKVRGAFSKDEHDRMVEDFIKRVRSVN
jgi:F-type H+-transporting ATPase subunit b